LIVIENLNTVIAKISKTGIYKRSDTPVFTALSVWDIDDTLYTTPKIRILIKNPKTKTIIKSLTTAQFANHHKREDLEYDFSQFTDAQYFYDNAKKTANFPKAIREFRNKSNFFIVLTARSNMYIKTKDDEKMIKKMLSEEQRDKLEEKAKKIFFSKFKNDGLPIDPKSPTAHVIRMGSLAPGYNKGKVITEILRAVQGSQTKITSVKYWDDSAHEVSTMCTAASLFNGKITFDITQVQKQQ